MFLCWLTTSLKSAKRVIWTVRSCCVATPRCPPSIRISFDGDHIIRLATSTTVKYSGSVAHASVDWIEVERQYGHRLGLAPDTTPQRPQFAQGSQAYIRSNLVTHSNYMVTICRRLALTRSFVRPVRGVDSTLVAADRGNRRSVGDEGSDLLDYEGALTWSCLDQAEVGEPLDRVADGIPRGVVVLSQLDLGPQLLTWLELA
jgi:hypothetical protein